MLDEVAHGKDSEAMLDEIVHDKDGKATLDEVARCKDGETILDEVARSKDNETVLGKVARYEIGEAMIIEIHAKIGSGLPEGDSIQSDSNFNNYHGSLGTWDVTKHLIG